MKKISINNTLKKCVSTIIHVIGMSLGYTLIALSFILNKGGVFLGLLLVLLMLL